MSRNVEDALYKQLKNPVDPRLLKWRVGATNQDKTKGIALPYLDAREVMRRLDDVCGVGGWQSTHEKVDGGFICTISIKIGDQWISKSNAGADSHIDPVKGGASDALKRTASVWGIGRYLYYLKNTWVGIKQQGRSYVLAEIPELPDWALPNRVENWQDIAEAEADTNTVGADEVEYVSNVKDSARASLLKKQAIIELNR